LPLLCGIFLHVLLFNFTVIVIFHQNLSKKGEFSRAVRGC